MNSNRFAVRLIRHACLLPILAVGPRLPTACAQCSPHWEPFAGGGVQWGVYSMATLDVDGIGPLSPALYAGGPFTTAGGQSASAIARWDGSAWSPLGSGMEYPGDDPRVATTSVFDADGSGPGLPALYAGGLFTRAGGVDARWLARWDGSAWHALPSGPNYAAYASTVFDDDGPGANPPALFIGGGFNRAGGVSAAQIAKWDGANWSALGSGVAGGNWPFYYSLVLSLAVFDDDGAGPQLPALYAGGVFTSAGGIPANFIAKWDGSSWSALGSGVQYEFCCDGGIHVSALAVFDEDGPGPLAPALYAGGSFTTPGTGIARWDGAAWSAVGGGTNRDVYSLAVFDEDGDGPGLPALYAGGFFSEAGGTRASRIAKWNGSSWSALAGGVASQSWTAVYALTVFDTDAAGPAPARLCAGGDFTSADGQPVQYVASWTGCGSSIRSFCFGDGSGTACPCGNSGASGHGCENSSFTGGAILAASGNPGLASDSLVLTCSGEPSSALSIFFQGSAAIAPTAFGDGLRCAGGELGRLYVKNASGGVVSAPTGSDPSVSSRSAASGDPLVPGYMRSYQTYYRDSNLGFCAPPAGDTWNVSQALSVVWNF